MAIEFIASDEFVLGHHAISLLPTPRRFERWAWPSTPQPASFDDWAREGQCSDGSLAAGSCR